MQPDRLVVTQPDRLAPELAVAVRGMTHEDLPAVLACERAGYQFPWSEGLFNDCLKAGYQCQVAVSEAGLVGFAILMCAVGEGHILNICVAPAARSKGVARQLMQACMQAAHERDVTEMFLEVRPSNTEALALYSTLGFNEIARRPDYYRAAHGREDALVLALTLLPR